LEDEEEEEEEEEKKEEEEEKEEDYDGYGDMNKTAITNKHLIIKQSTLIVNNSRICT
jgi:hypothetical protein